MWTNSSFFCFCHLFNLTISGQCGQCGLMSDTNTKQAQRYTVPMAAEVAGELEEIADRTGLPVAALLRQGAVRIINEFRGAGSVTSQALEPVAA
jgi:hypothetical protein